MQPIGQRTMDRRLAVGVVFVAAFYRPLIIWATNAWDMSDPGRVLALGGFTFAAGLVGLVILTRLRVRPLPASLVMGGLLLGLMNWSALGSASGPLLLLLLISFGWLGNRVRSAGLLESIAVILIAVFGVAPALQVGLGHIRKSEPYPVTQAPTIVGWPASGRVEDVVLVVVDAYPSLRIAQSWFGHDAVLLRRSLEGLGFEIEADAWGRHTYTPLSVASILQLQSVVREGPTSPSMNWSSLFEITRGNNVVSATLRSAGFQYTHIESGWDGTSCGPKVDRCDHAPWVEEQVWQVIAPSVFASPLEDRYFTISGTFHAAQALDDQLRALTANGSHDYLFAHLLLPHVPVRVDSNCAMVDYPSDIEADAVRFRAAMSAQISCTDRLLSHGLESVDDNTAVLVLGDHGPSTSFQLGLAPHEWSDADIAERFSVLLAYKLPQTCDGPDVPDLVAAMAAVMSCAVDHRFIAPPPEYMIGIDNPQSIDPLRFARIKELVESDSLAPSSDRG